MSKKSISKAVLIGVIGGAVASWVKGKVEPPLQELGTKKFPPAPGETSLKGADVINHPENMPPAVLAQTIYQLYTGNELDKERRIKSIPYIHYGMGIALGALYSVLVSKNKKLALDGGLAMGAAIWSATHGSTLPLLGLQDKVKDMPKSWWVWEFGSHLIYGTALESARRVLKKIF